MLFRKALRRDLLNLAGIVFSTLFVIMVTTSLIRLLGRAAGGRVDTASVLPLIAFNAINVLPVLLVLTLYIAVLTVLTRAYRDSEMVVWFASGQSLLAWIRPVLGFAAPFVVLIALVAFLLAPWANRQAAEYQQRFAQREDVSQVAAGRFRESVSANRVFFVESLDEAQNQVRNVFVTQRQGEGIVVVVSRGGQIERQENGERFLVLENGRRYDGGLGRLDFRLMEFERYGIRLEQRATALSDDRARIKTTWELLRDPNERNLAELLWRIGLPVSAILVALLAIPLSAMNPRIGRSINLFAALLVYVLYNNLMSVAQAWVAQGRIDFSIGVWIVHAALAAIVALMFWQRIRLPRRSLFSMLALRRSRSAA
ncbi:LPS export ABC transporter permease LptF [Burkholderiaceae bacterium FT117]|uniref:LPS export ABC transporter permease LptF n=1 Tax=Zeimonas sediminis TaxID=2944268 RepID=UPI002342E6BA|nr:LPS export ABC transporter permease LptF [Zeimonas sediminis]MCM5570173.1 LPS export ABC transporter permease LptF [Zeimonas sediminis]